MIMKRGKVDKQGESMVASYRHMEVSNPGSQMIGSNECDVSCDDVINVLPDYNPCSSM